MTEISSDNLNCINRRSLLKGGLLVCMGAATIGVASSSLTGVARAATVTVSATDAANGDVVTMTAQNDWWWCDKCYGLFWYGGTDRPAATGVCPADGEDHTAGSSTNYSVPMNNAATTDVQSGWRWCGACAGLFYGPDVSTSHCMAAPIASDPVTTNGPHTLSSTTSYDLMMGDWTSAGNGVQGNWRFCARCKGLWWAGDPSNSECPASPVFNNHTSGTTDYFIVL